MSLAKVGGALALVFMVAGGGVYSCSPRVTEREAAMKIVRGELVDPALERGIYPSAMLPHVEIIRLPKFLQTTPVSALEQDDVTIRTREDARIYGTFQVLWELDNQSPDFQNIYTELKADEIKDLEPYIARYTIPAAIDTYKTVATNAVNEDLTGIGQRIAERLQQILHDRGYTYLRIKDVIPSGVGLSDKANADLEQIVSEERKLDLQRAQGQVAEGAIEITKKQAAVTAEALKALREAGVPEEDLIAAYYLQLMRDNDKIGTPFVPGPVQGTGVGAVSAPAPAAP